MNDKMDNSSKLSLLNSLASLGVEFTLRTQGPWGDESFPCDAYELLELLHDHNAFKAKRYGVEKSDYISWVNDGYTVKCAALTAKKKPCQNHVTGGTNVSPKKYKEMQGQYCCAHEGDYIEIY